MFGVYVHETNVKTSRLIKTFKNKLEALGYIEEIAEEFITTKCGEDRAKEPSIIEPSSYKSLRWNKLPYGYFKTKNTCESLNKLTIWNKTKNEGYLYNSYELNKIFSMDLVYLPESLVVKSLNSVDAQMKVLRDIFNEDDSYDEYCDEKIKYMEIMINKVFPLIKSKNIYENEPSENCDGLNKSI